MLKGKDKLSIKEDISKVRKWDIDFPRENKIKIIISNNYSSFGMIVKLSVLEKIEKLTVTASWANGTILGKLKRICSDFKFYSANNLLIANRNRGIWIAENINLHLLDLHSKVALIKTESNYYILVGSENYGNPVVGELEHYQILNSEKTYSEVLKYLKSIEKCQTQT